MRRGRRGLITRSWFAIVVAAFFYYPLAPTAIVLALVFIANLVCFA